MGTDLSQKASIVTGVSNYDNFDGKVNILPAITGLPLPPTPEMPLPALPNLPPVLGSPTTTNSTILESARDAKSNHTGPPSATSGTSDIYHNIVNNKINTK